MNEKDGFKPQADEEGQELADRVKHMATMVAMVYSFRNGVRDLDYLSGEEIGSVLEWNVEVEVTASELAVRGVSTRDSVDLLAVFPRSAQVTFIPSSVPSLARVAVMAGAIVLCLLEPKYQLAFNYAGWNLLIEEGNLYHITEAGKIPVFQTNAP